MRLTVIGCSGSFAGPESAASCYLVEADDADGRTWRILLDLGSGALGALQRYADPASVDDPADLADVAHALGAQLLMRQVCVAEGVPRHDPLRLAAAYRDLFAGVLGDV